MIDSKRVIDFFCTQPDDRYTYSRIFQTKLQFPFEQCSLIPSFQIQMNAQIAGTKKHKIVNQNTHTTYSSLLTITNNRTIITVKYEVHKCYLLLVNFHSAPKNLQLSQLLIFLKFMLGFIYLFVLEIKKRKVISFDCPLPLLYPFSFPSSIHGYSS